jgi:hypothetical protein
MRQILKRFGIYLLYLLVVAALFDVLGEFGYYAVVGLVLVGLLWALVYELIYRCVSWGRHQLSKESEQAK